MAEQFIVQHGEKGDVFLMQADHSHAHFALTLDRRSACRYASQGEAEEVCERLVAAVGVAYRVVSAEG